MTYPPHETHWEEEAARLDAEQDWYKPEKPDEEEIEK